ncbi:MAG TPA: hypothetical protein VD971_04890 [Phycisphaerales bacterium]|nr:hypothetical protein [Phycisphaerales bacterium]
MRTRRRVITIGALCALNGALGAALLWPSAAGAQNSRVSDLRARGDYTMVSGRTNSGGPSAVYVVDSANQEVIALKWDQSKQVMVGIGYRSLLNDSRGGRGR